MKFLRKSATFIAKIEEIGKISRFCEKPIEIREILQNIRKIRKKLNTEFWKLLHYIVTTVIVSIYKKCGGGGR